MPRFRIEVIETVKMGATICVISKTQEAAKRKLQKMVNGKYIDGFDKWYTGDKDIIAREIVSIKQLPSASEERAIRNESKKRLRKIDELVNNYIKNADGDDGDIYVEFSACKYEDENCNLPIVSTLDTVPIRGKIVVFEGGYVSPIMENPTWLQLCHIANNQIKYSGNHHYTFLESISIENRVPQWVRNRVGDDVIFCVFEMG